MMLIQPYLMPNDLKIYERTYNESTKTMNIRVTWVRIEQEDSPKKNAHYTLWTLRMEPKRMQIAAHCMLFIETQTWSMLFVCLHAPTSKAQRLAILKERSTPSIDVLESLRGVLKP